MARPSGRTGARVIPCTCPRLRWWWRSLAFLLRLDVLLRRCKICCRRLALSRAAWRSRPATVLANGSELRGAEVPSLAIAPVLSWSVSAAAEVSGQAAMAVPPGKAAPSLAAMKYQSCVDRFWSALERCRLKQRRSALVRKKTEITGWCEPDARRMDGASPLERLLKRDRSLRLRGWRRSALLAWVYVVAGAGLGMSAVGHDEARALPHQQFQRHDPHEYA